MSLAASDLPPGEIEFSAIRAQGAGGQNVNKVSSAIHLRFAIPASSLPDEIKQRLLALSDQRISKDGVLVIKAQEFRTQEKNRAEALRRAMLAMIDDVKKPHWSHPAYWAPFVVVGEGAVAR